MLAIMAVIVSAAPQRVVVAGAGLHGASLAYYLSKRGVAPVIVEEKAVACAASGKGGGFITRDCTSRPPLPPCAWVVSWASFPAALLAP